MTQKKIKFDKDGRIIRQNITYLVKHEEEINDIIKEIEKKNKEKRGV